MHVICSCITHSSFSLSPASRLHGIDLGRTNHTLLATGLFNTFELHVRQFVPSQCLAQPMAMQLVVVRSRVKYAVFSMGQISRCCMVCLMPQSHISASFENPHFNVFTLDRPTCARKRSSAFQVIQGFSAPAGRCSSALNVNVHTGV